MSDRAHHVCPMERAGSLERRVRRWMHNPGKILGAHVREGMTVLDFGCGPGYFTLPLARMVGASGRVIACDVQQGMLDRVREKVRGTPIEGRVRLHRVAEGQIGLDDKADFILAFYVAHEVPDRQHLFAEFAAMAAPGASVLVVEPRSRVSRREFDETLHQARESGFRIESARTTFLDRAAVLRAG